MPINIAEWKTPKREMRLESSSNDYFLKRVKEIDKEFKKLGYDPDEVRKVRTLGDGRVQADVQRMIDGKRENPFEKAEKQPERAIAVTGNTTDEELAHATTPPPLETVTSDESIAGDVVLPEPKHKV